MRHVKLARDRRKKRSRIKVGVFFLSIMLILTGALLSLRDKVDPNETAQSAVENQDKTEVQYQSLGNEPEAKAETLAQNKEEDATSYDDDSEQDDEVEEIKLPFDEDLADLPQDAKDALSGLLDAADVAIRISDQFSHTVVKGENLQDILEVSGLDNTTANELQKAYPELKNLKAGQQFYWILDKNDHLEYLNWLVSEKEERIYERSADNQFKRQILEKKSVWKNDVLKGKINGSFANSLRSTGLDNRQINQLMSALQWQVNLQNLPKDTPFAIWVYREYLGDQLTGQGNVKAIRIAVKGKSYYGIQAANGRYYDRQGETLGKGFARYPLQRQARISSQFNPNRKHPVTGRVRPHRGVDFAVSPGTVIIAPADGVVEKIAYQAGGAGRYVVLRHGKEYQTVYMHLTKALVRAGQSVKKGEHIALSGNTGISTGPHLHYEFRINGRPVNPLTVKLPGGSSGMNNAERKQYLTIAKEAERLLAF